jgi:hypothetical protein
MRRRLRVVGLRMIPIGIAAIGVLGVVVMALWNALLPPIFGLPRIGFWQGLGLFLLTHLLFGGVGGGKKTRVVRGWKDLTDEERERFRRAMRAEGEGGEQPQS